MISDVNPSELVKCSSENICLVIKFFAAVFNKLTRIHVTNHNIFTSLLFLFHYCFNNTADLILLILDHSPISRVTIPEAVIIQFVLLKMSKVLLENHVEDYNVTCILL